MTGTSHGTTECPEKRAAVKQGRAGRRYAAGPADRIQPGRSPRRLLCGRPDRKPGSRACLRQRCAADPLPAVTQTGKIRIPHGDDRLRRADQTHTAVTAGTPRNARHDGKFQPLRIRPCPHNARLHGPRAVVVRADAAGCLNQGADLPAHCPDLPQDSALPSRLWLSRSLRPLSPCLLLLPFLPCLLPALCLPPDTRFRKADGGCGGKGENPLQRVSPFPPPRPFSLSFPLCVPLSLSLSCAYGGDQRAGVPLALKASMSLRSLSDSLFRDRRSSSSPAG